MALQDDDALGPSGSMQSAMMFLGSAPMFVFRVGPAGLSAIGIAFAEVRKRPWTAPGPHASQWANYQPCGVGTAGSL